ncbi:MAG TPA: TonB-dependent receptor [Cyclobacteriaceae bacterium]|nr:TonB-dependent receptor [Cyclobacteriaceae bacterium]
MKQLYFFTILIFSSLPGVAQTLEIKGIVKDNEGERMPQAYVTIMPGKLQVATEKDGTFSFTTKEGKVRLSISYTGFQHFYSTFFLQKDTTLIITLQPSVDQLKEVVVTSKAFLQSDQLHTTRMSSVTLTGKEINSIPVLGGEADLLKVIQLLPGTSKGVEGSTDLFVRGGAADQNLVLLDGAPVYNTGHLLGFLSVFNPDILDGVEYMSGAFPAEYGGRLSSILDVRTKSTFPDKTHVQGNIGLLASRLKIEQPLIKDKLTIWVAGRRTYIDQVMKLAHQELPYYFYDLNVKVNYHPTARDQVELSTYAGEDILDFNGLSNRRRQGNVVSKSDIGNSTQSLRWRRKLNNEWSSTLTLVRSVFRYSIFNKFEDSQLFVKSNIQDLGGKLVLSSDSLQGLSFKGGIEFTNHAVSPNIISTSGELSQLLESSSTQSQNCIEASAFVQADGNATERLRWSAGLRMSSGIVSGKTYVNPEPRLALRYTVNDRTTVKASYSRMAQYLHRVSSAAVSFPTDIWYPVTKTVQPQTSNQYSVALQHTIPKSNLYISVEGYYKHLDKLVGYREGTNLFLNNNFESQLIQGEGRAYGTEVLIKKEAGKLTGWISYTLSWSQRKFNEINNDNWYFSRYDRRHNGALVLNYQLNKCISLSAVWEFISGSRFTPIIGQYIVPAPSLGGFNLVPVYAQTNSVKLSDTHRLDLGLKYRQKAHKYFQGEWFVGVYNVYNRAAPIGIFIEPKNDGSYQYVQPGLFGLLPFVSYGFKF